MSELVYQYRRRRQGLPTVATPGETFWDIPVPGFLLRSALVSGWPGMEIEVYDAGESKMEILRLDHLGSGVVLGLASGELHHVVLKEPREGIRFGVDDDLAIALHQWQGKAIGQNVDGQQSYTMLSGKRVKKTTGATETKLYGIRPSLEDVTRQITPQGCKAPPGLLRQDAAAGVLDVAALYDNLKQIQGNKSNFGTGAFALQALVAPETAEVKWGETSQGGQ